MVQDDTSMNKVFTDLIAILAIDECSRTPFSLSRVFIGSTPARISIHKENAVNGEHLWLETNVSGDLCYLGEENCQVRFAKLAIRLCQMSFVNPNTSLLMCKLSRAGCEVLCLRFVR
ncbi:hypothetical protein ACRRTK_015852 [Alexandromys fortis]